VGKTELIKKFLQGKRGIYILCSRTTLLENLQELKRKFYEVIVALNGKTSEIVFGECKWQENVDAQKVLDALKGKSKFVKWRNEKRKEYYLIVAKSFEKKIEEENVILIDLNDLEMALK
jgi:AAA+ ATPase superfamily predicted ATPase